MQCSYSTLNAYGTILDIRGMFLSNPTIVISSLFTIVKLEWPWMHEYFIMTQQCITWLNSYTSTPSSYHHHYINIVISSYKIKVIMSSSLYQYRYIIISNQHRHINRPHIATSFSKYTSSYHPIIKNFNKYSHYHIFESSIIYPQTRWYTSLNILHYSSSEFTIIS